MINKRGLSTYVSLMMIALVAVGGVVTTWFVVRQVTIEAQNDIVSSVDLLSLKLSIVRESIQLSEDGNISFFVQRTDHANNVSGFGVIVLKIGPSVTLVIIFIGFSLCGLSDMPKSPFGSTTKTLFVVSDERTMSLIGDKSVRLNTFRVLLPDWEVRTKILF